MRVSIIISKQNNKNSPVALTLLTLLLFKNRCSVLLPGFTPDEPRTSKDADKIGNPRRQYSWNSTALPQGGSNGHDGIVDKNDDNADAQADGGTGAMRR